MKSITNKVVAITGASSGIGWATALAFAKRGCKVAACARREERLHQLAERIRQEGGECLAFPVDVAQRDQVERFVRRIVEVWGRLDVIVCNAGYGYYASLEEVTPEGMDQIWKVNFMGTFHLIQAALPAIKRQQEGHIVIVSSVVGRYSLPMTGAYCVTKAAQASLGQALRLELRPFHIGVTLVYPGYTKTEFGQSQVNAEKRPSGSGAGAQLAELVAEHIVQAVRKNKKEIYPNFLASLYAHSGLYFPWFLDEAMARFRKR